MRRPPASSILRNNRLWCSRGGRLQCFRRVLPPHDRYRRASMRLSRVWPVALMLVPFGALVLLLWVNPTPPAAAAQRAVKAPDFEGAAGWLNTAGPLRMADLKGKIVVLDFW